MKRTYKGYTITYEDGMWQATNGVNLLMAADIKGLVEEIEFVLSLEV